jgi:hypothetical protein
MPSQLPRPALQAIAQTPLTQLGVPPTEEQRTPHPTPPAEPAIPPGPQWFTFVSVVVSQPFASIPSQLPVPAPHITVETPHMPPLHTAVVPAGAGHCIPHRPQLATFPVVVFTSHPLAGLPSQSA